jgi:hypothetical protein
VADPATGKVVRVFLSAERADSGAVALGQRVAEKLIEAGAGPLLELHQAASGGDLR